MLHLFDIFKRRRVPAAGLYISTTKRCPLECGHCHVESGPNVVEAITPSALLRFVRTFAEAQAPEFMVLTGGEPLMAPEVVSQAARLAATSNTRTVLCSGMFFARNAIIPKGILAAIQNVDHLAASIDSFHEQFVPRQQVFEALDQIRNLGIGVSIHTVTDSQHRDLIRQIRNHFKDTVPIAVYKLNASGRAAKWMVQNGPEAVYDDVTPCGVAAWPVIGYDSQVVACCSKTPSLNSSPKELVFGKIETLSWPKVRDIMSHSLFLRKIRAFGPWHQAKAMGIPIPKSYCETCCLIANKSSGYDDPKPTFKETLELEFAESILQDLPFEPAAEYKELLHLGRPTKVHS